MEELLASRAEAAGYEVSRDGDGVALDGAPITGFHMLPPEPLLVELSGEPDDDREGFFGSLGFLCEWVEEAPGFVLGRIVCQLVNEACFAVGEGVGSADDVDAGMTLGLNHPRGPMAWGEAIGFTHVLETIESLWVARREERYRPAPLLQRLAREP